MKLSENVVPAGSLTDPAARIELLDVLRGIAVMGILLVNIWVMGSVPSAEIDPRVSGWSVADQAIWWFQMMFVEGTMRGLLSLLFGAGFVILTKSEGSGAHFYRRAFILILFGLAHGYLLLWPGDILLIYGLAALFLFPLKGLAPRQMAGVGVAALAMLVGLGLGSTLELTNKRLLAEAAMEAGAEADDARVEAWAAHLREVQSPARSDERSRSARAGSVEDNLTYKIGVANHWNHPASTRIWLFDAFGMMLIGAALFRVGSLGGRAPPSSYVLLMAVGYGAGLALNAVQSWQFAAADFAVPIPIGLWSDQIGRTLVTLGHLGLIGWLWRTGRAKRFLRVFAPAGRLALTNYIGQTLLCQWLLFPGFALGLHGALSIAELYVLAAVIISGQLAFSGVYLKHFAYGPLEWLWRWGTYGRRPAFFAG